MDASRTGAGGFGDLLRQLRVAAGLTQEELAEQAGLSVRGLSDLERGARQTPHPETLRRLVEALRLNPAHRAALVAAGTARLGKSAVSSGASSLPADQSSDARVEPKPATAVCCQVIINSQIPPEDQDNEALLNVLATFFEGAVAEVKRFEGTVGEVNSDGFTALFGLPVTHEDHARRAILSTLAVQRRMRELADLPAAAGMQLRMGVHTGLIGIGTLPGPHGRHATTIGPTTAIAAALQHAAQPGTIVISDSVARLVAGYVRLETVPPIAVPNQSDPLVCHRVVGIGPRRSPIEGIGSRALSPFVGRKREIFALRSLLDQVESRPTPAASTRRFSQFVGRETDLAALRELLAKGEAGRGQVVGVVAEPGMGKSRLLYEFRRSLAGRRFSYLEGRCLSYGTNTPYLPVLDLVRANCGLQESDTPEIVADKVRFGLQEVGLNPDSHAPIVLHLLGHPDTEAALSGLRPEVVKARTFETLRNWAVLGSQQRPLIVAVEDLHWIDRSSEEYLTSLVERIAGAPILLICTWRPGYRPPWADHSYVTHLVVRRLDPEDSLSILQSVWKGTRVSGTLARRALERAEGNPFFLEELARTVVNTAVDSAEAHAPLPDTIQGVLLARLDQLPDLPRRVLQTAAVIGRESSLRLLTAVWNEPTPLAGALAELTRQEFVYERSVRQEPVVVFKHVLTQEAAYASIVKSRRRALHARVSQVLVERFREVIDAQPELLAHHYTAAGMVEPAIDAWQRAGDRAAERSANAEAISHLMTAIHLLRSRPDTEERARRELALQIAVGGPLIASRGYGANETVQAHARARELAEQVNDAGQLFPLLYRKWVTHTIWSQQHLARHTAEEFLGLARQQADSGPRMMGHRMLAITQLFLGELPEARAHFGQALALYEPDKHRALAFRYGQEPRASGLAWLSIALWLSGDDNEAVRTVGEAIAAARESQHVNTLAYVLFYSAALLAQLRGDVDALHGYVQETLDLAEKNGLAMWRAYATVLDGWGIGTKSEPGAAIARMSAGLAELEATGTALLRPHFLGLLARMQAKAGQVNSALAVLSDALERARSSGEHWCEAELLRLQQELMSGGRGASSSDVVGLQNEAGGLARP